MTLMLSICILLGTMLAHPLTASAATEGDYTYEVANGEATITAFDNSISGGITIPETLGGYPVVGIGSDAFFYCNDVTSITIPDSVTSISYGAFEGCNSLTDIYYSGTEEEWNAISIGSSNVPVTNATIHYDYSQGG